MAAWYRFSDWPLRAKMVALLVVASMLPLGIATWLRVGNAREQLLRDTEQLLIARAEQLVQSIDDFNENNLISVQRTTKLPQVEAVLRASPAELARLRPAIRALFSVGMATQESLRGLAILDASGTVLAGTEPELYGMNLAFRSHMKSALQGKDVISDVYIDEQEAGGVPSIAYLSPVFGPQGQLRGLVAYWIKATALRDNLRKANGLAGRGSFAALIDRYGVRIAHSADDGLVYRPVAPLDPADLEALVAERRFGALTRKYLQDVRTVAGNFTRESLIRAELGMFSAPAANSRDPVHAVGRRVHSAPWTIYFLVPERLTNDEIASMTRDNLLFAAVIMLLAMAVGAAFAELIIQPVRGLTAGARTLATGNMEVRVDVARRDELGELSDSFNHMAARIRVLTDELLQESRTRYSDLFGSMIEGFCAIEMLYGADGQPVDFRILETNPSLARQTGLTDVVGKLGREIMPDLEKHWLLAFARVVQTGEPISIERESNELNRFIQMHVYRIGAMNQHRVAVLITDLSEQKRTEGHLKAQVERLDLLQKITHAIDERLDLSSIFQVAVSSLEEQLPVDFCCILTHEPARGGLRVSRTGPLSLSLAEAVGLKEGSEVLIDQNGLSRCIHGQLVYEGDISAVAFAFPQRLSSAGMRALVVAPLIVEGRVFAVLAVARRKLHGFSSNDCEFLRQLCEHMALAAHQAQLYGEVQAAYEELRRTQQMTVQHERLRALGQMASGIAHDINNAISPIALYADSLLERLVHLDSQSRGQLQTIQRAIHDVAETVARLKEFYRPREHQASFVPLQLNEVVPQVVELTRARWSTQPQQRGITITLHTELAENLPTISGSGSEIRDALTNLVFNAVDAMPQGGTLTLRTRVNASGYVEIEVNDTGVGMDDETHRRCMDPFFTTKGERGSGLGLAMVYGVTQRHGGEMEIDSVAGRGTKVRLRFAATTARAAPQVLPEVPVLPSLKLLVIDDDPALLRSLGETLRQDGHEVVTANGGAAGLNAFRVALEAGTPFTAVLTDLGMPHVDGRQVAITVNSLAPDTPVIMLTGWGQRMMEGELPPFVDVLISKPPRMRDLRGALARCCGNLAN